MIDPKMYITTRQAELIKVLLEFDPKDYDGFVVVDELPVVDYSKQEARLKELLAVKETGERA